MKAKTTDEILDKIGSLGLFQIRVFAIISYTIMFCSLVLMVMTFSTAEPPWRCVANSSSCTFNGTFKAGQNHYSHRCVIPRNEWEFEVDGDFDSIVTEWDLVCDKAVYASIANSLLFVLWMFGAMVASILSDKFGRKTVVFPFTLWASACGFLSAFAQKYWVFALFRALAGIGIGGYSICAFVLVLEYVSPRHRGLVGMGIWSGLILGMCLLALLGYFIRSWRTLTIITSAPGLLFFIFWWFTPESLRWLLVKGKFEEAKKTLKTVARVNKKDLTDEDLALLGNDDQQQTEVRLGDVRDLFASRPLVHRTLISWYCWFVSGLIYYGITLSTPTVGGNMYLNFFISAVCEGIGMAIAVPLLNRFGRKKTIVASLWLCSIVVITAALLNFYDDGSTGYMVGKVLTAMVLGKFFITIVFDGVYIYSTELFPTVVRNTAMGTSTSAARVGSALAPYVVFSTTCVSLGNKILCLSGTSIFSVFSKQTMPKGMTRDLKWENKYARVDLERAHPLMPFGIMAINAVICGILCMTLPETNNVAMPDTVQQVSNKDRNVTAVDGKDENLLPLALHGNENTQL